MIADDRPAVVLPDGMSAIPKPIMAPPTGVFFGWIDFADDENTFRFDDIIGAQRNVRDGRYYMYVRNLGQPIPLPEKDYFRLLKKFGWTEKDRIARAS